MKNITLYIGCNVGASAMWNTDDVCEVLKMCHVENATITTAQGFYCGTLENTVCVFVANADERTEAQLRYAVEFIKCHLSQECVGWEETKAEFSWK